MDDAAQRLSLALAGRAPATAAGRRDSTVSQKRAEVTIHQLRVFWAIAHSDTLTKAAKQLGLAQPSLSQQLSKLEQLELEYAENARRKDLTWQENLESLAKLEELRRAQAESAGETKNPVVLAREVAKEVSGASGLGAVASTFTDLMLAKRLSNPEIAGAKSLTEAKKIAKRQDEAARRETLAQIEAGLLLAAGKASNQRRLIGAAAAKLDADSDGNHDQPAGSHPGQALDHAPAIEHQQGRLTFGG